MDQLLLLKLLLPPSLVLLGTWAGRRWGRRIGGFVAGFPNNTGPVLLLITLQQGVGFGARTAEAAVLGFVAVAAFDGLYPHLARRWAWWVCLPLAWLAYSGSMLALHQVHWPWWASMLAALAALNLARWLMPQLPPAPHTAKHLLSPLGDLVLRAAAAVLMVLLLTGLAGWLGPQLSGLLTPFPITSAVLAVFAHLEGGAAAAEETLKGVLTALNAVAVFAAVTALLLPLWGLAPAFGLGLLAGGLLQVLQFHWHH